MQSLWLKDSTAEERDRQLRATVAALIGIGPKDESEGMTAAHKHGRYTAEALARQCEVATLIRTMRALADAADEAE